MLELKEILTKIKPEGLSDKERDLFRGIKDGLWSTDQEALQFFWPENENGQHYLWKLKNKLFGKLINSILKQTGKSSYQALYIECWREFAAIQVLRGLNFQKSAFWMGERLIKKTIKYEITEITVILSLFLEFDAARLIGDRNKQQEYRRTGKKYEEIVQAERKAQRYFLELTAGFATSQSIEKTLIEQSGQYSHELEKLLKSINSFQFAFYSYSVLCTHAQLLGNYSKVIELCQQALNFFNLKEYSIPRSALFLFTFKPIQAAIKMQDYVTAKRYIDVASTIDPKGSHNHNACLLYQAITGFHSENNELIKSAIQESLKHRKYDPIIEQWRIIEAYATLFDIETGVNFRLSKFLNEVPIFSKDKRGNNITILILQILFYLKTGKRGKIIDRVEALKQYSQRYLKKDENFRSNCFIYMLLTIVKGNFHPVAVSRYAKKYRDRLKEYQSSEVEVVRYEKLWKKVLDLLEKN